MDVIPSSAYYDVVEGNGVAQPSERKPSDRRPAVGTDQYRGLDPVYLVYQFGAEQRCGQFASPFDEKRREPRLAQAIEGCTQVEVTVRDWHTE